MMFTDLTKGKGASFFSYCVSLVESSSCFSMVLILDGNSEICAHVRSNLCYLICFYLSREDLFCFMRAQYVLFYHLIYNYHGFFIDSLHRFRHEGFIVNNPLFTQLYGNQLLKVKLHFFSHKTQQI